MPDDPKTTETERRLRRLLGDVYSALLRAGWHDDEMLGRVRADADLGHSPFPPPAEQNPPQP